MNRTLTPVAPGPVRLSPKVAAPLPGTPYDQLGRTVLHRWWRPPLTLLMSLVYWLGFGMVVMAVVATINAATGTKVADDQMFTDPTVDAIGWLVLAALGVPAVLLAARWPGRRPMGTLSSITLRIRWRWLGLCTAVATVSTAVVYSAGEVLIPSGEATIEGSWVGLNAFVVPALMLLVLVPFQAAGEEYLFRGLLLQGFGAYLRGPIPGLVVSSVLFAAAHGFGTWWGFADLLLFAVLAGVLTLRTGGLEAAIGLHAMNNVVGFLILAGIGRLDDDSTAADAPWQALAIEMVLLPAYALVILELARRWRPVTATQRVGSGR